MEISSAVSLVDNVIYKPGWSFEAHDNSERFEGTITVKVLYPARQSNRADAPCGFPIDLVNHASFHVIVGDCTNVVDLLRKVLKMIDKIDEHEAREFLRVAPTNWAPFHPHKPDGMKRWGDVDGDLSFGAV